MATFEADEWANERELVLAAKANPADFEPLYRKYADLIYRYAYRKLGDADQSADATSQIFIKAITSIGSCREEAFRSWLFAIAHNVLIDVYRDRKPDVALDAELELVSGEISPEEVAIASDERSRIVELLRLLTPDQRQVVEMRLAGLNGNEIAAALGRSRASVDTAQSRAIARLRAAIGNDPWLRNEMEARDAIA